MTYQLMFAVASLFALCVAAAVVRCRVWKITNRKLSARVEATRTELGKLK